MSTYRDAAAAVSATRADTWKTIEVRPLTPVIGAEIFGVDLSQTIRDDQWDEIRSAFLQHQVLFIRDQSPLAPEQQIAFGRRFGELHVHPAAPCLPGYPEVMVIQADALSKTNYGERWHTDVSCDKEPPLCSILQLHKIPPVGGDTMFASMYAAYEALSRRLKDLLAGLTAMHESEHHYRGRYAERGVEDAGKVYPSAEHPVVCAHPETKRPYLFVNTTFTTQIRGIEPAEAQMLLSFLLRHIENPYFQVRFRWRVNDVAVWDNRCTQHIAIWDYWPHERSGHRVTVKGSRPLPVPDPRPSG